MWSSCNSWLWAGRRSLAERLQSVRTGDTDWHWLLQFNLRSHNLKTNLMSDLSKLRAYVEEKWENWFWWFWKGKPPYIKLVYIRALPKQGFDRSCCAHLGTFWHCGEKLFWDVILTARQQVAWAKRHIWSSALKPSIVGTFWVGLLGQKG